MNLQDAFEKAKIQYEVLHASDAEKLKLQRPNDLKNVDKDSITEIFISSKFSGELPCLKDYPNLEKLSVSSNCLLLDLTDPELSGIKELSVFVDYECLI